MEKEQYEKVLEAIDGSIEKWNSIVHAEGEDEGRHNCPLCKIFFDSDECDECPIRKDTDKKSCRDTPYDVFEKHWNDVHRSYTTINRTIVCETCSGLARDELEYLKGLREKYIDENKSSLDEYFWAIESPERPISDHNNLVIVDKDKKIVNHPYVLSLFCNRITAYEGTNRKIGLELDDLDRIKLEN